MPILAAAAITPPPTPAPVTRDESDRVLALVKQHASASSYKNLVSSLRAKPDPYPFPVS